MKKTLMIGLVLMMALALGAPYIHAQQQSSQPQTSGWYCPWAGSPAAAGQGGWYCPRMGQAAAAGQTGWTCPRPGGRGMGYGRMGRGCRMMYNQPQSQPQPQPQPQN